MAKKFDAKAKAKRQKIIAGGGAVLLLGILAISVPMTLKKLNAKAPVQTPPPATSAQTPGAAPLAPPTLGGTVAVAPTAGGLASADAVPTPTKGQLVSFGRFDSKDPFSQQISSQPPAVTPQPAGAAQGGATPTPAPVGSGAVPASGGRQTPSPGGQSTTTTTSTTPAAPRPPPTSATISVNGTAEPVAAKADFPQADPIFHLVAVSKTSVKISIAGGSYASGAPTVTLKKGEPLTLMNTADGTRYELSLISTV